MGTRVILKYALFLTIILGSSIHGLSTNNEIVVKLESITFNSLNRTANLVFKLSNNTVLGEPELKIKFYNGQDSVVAITKLLIQPNQTEIKVSIDIFDFFVTKSIYQVYFDHYNIFQYQIIRNNKEATPFAEYKSAINIDVRSFYIDLRNYLIVFQQDTRLFYPFLQAFFDYEDKYIEEKQIKGFNDAILCKEMETLYKLNEMMQEETFWNPYLYSACKRQFYRINEYLAKNLKKFAQTLVIRDINYLEIKFDQCWGIHYDLFKANFEADSQTWELNEGVKRIIEAALEKRDVINTNDFSKIFKNILPEVAFNYISGMQPNGTFDSLRLLCHAIENEIFTYTPSHYSPLIIDLLSWQYNNLKNKEVADSMSRLQNLNSNDSLYLYMTIAGFDSKGYDLKTQKWIVDGKPRKNEVGIPNYLIDNQITLLEDEFKELKRSSAIQKIQSIIVAHGLLGSNLSDKFIGFLSFYYGAGLLSEDLLLTELSELERNIQNETNLQVIEMMFSDQQKEFENLLKQSIERPSEFAFLSDLYARIIDCDSILKRNNQENHPYWKKFKYELYTEFWNYIENNSSAIEIYHWQYDKLNKFAVLNHVLRFESTQKFIETCFRNYQSYTGPENITSLMQTMSNRSCGEIGMISSGHDNKFGKQSPLLYSPYYEVYKKEIINGLTNVERDLLFKDYLIKKNQDLNIYFNSPCDSGSPITDVKLKFSVNEEDLGEYLSHHINYLNMDVYMGSGFYRFTKKATEDKFPLQILNAYFSTQIDSSKWQQSIWKSFQPFVTSNLQTYSGRGVSGEMGYGVRWFLWPKNKTFLYGNLLIEGMYYNTDKRLVDDLEVNSFYEMEAGGRFGYNQICNWGKIKRYDLNIGGFGSLPPARRTYVAIGDVENRDIRFGGAMLAVTAHTKDSRFLFNLGFKHYIPIKVESNSMLKKDYRTLWNFQILLKLNK